jgi:hypothetical protein
MGAVMELRVRAIGRCRAESDRPATHESVYRICRPGPCWALEEIIDERCADLAAPAPSATARSKLLILRALDTAETGDRAAAAWNRLGNACHLHAYEMQPSTAEVEQLCGVVAGLLP